jgi:DNA-binding response OmpR family regulator
MEDGAYRFADSSLFPCERLLTQGTDKIALPPKVFDAMHLLVRNYGRLVLRQEIVKAPSHLEFAHKKVRGEGGRAHASDGIYRTHDFPFVF